MTASSVRRLAVGRAGCAHVDVEGGEGGGVCVDTHGGCVEMRSLGYLGLACWVDCAPRDVQVHVLVLVCKTVLGTFFPVAAAAVWVFHPGRWAESSNTTLSAQPRSHLSLLSGGITRACAMGF